MLERLGFSGGKPPAKAAKDAARGAKQEARKGVRGVEHELAALEKEEREALANAKCAARRGDTKLAETHAKTVVRLRAQKERLVGVQSRLQQASASATVAQAHVTAAASLAASAEAMRVMNDVTSAAVPQQSARDFALESAKAELAAEAMDDVFEDMFGLDSDAEEESERLTDSVLEELGLGAAAQLPRVPVAPDADDLPNVPDSAQQDIRRRLEALRAPTAAE